uniref:Uncharacterized protein n=1 Tax=Rhizophora mucronata TaxID=61149 RepID=A0A2P2IQZ1_RHIMU
MKQNHIDMGKSKIMETLLL